MPFVRLTVADPELSADVAAELARRITALLESDLGKDPKVAVVSVQPTSDRYWFVGGEPTPGATGAHVEVVITEGTNTAGERAAFIDHTYGVLGEVLGVLPAAVYVAFDIVEPEAWGYNGISQLARRRGETDHR